MYARGIPFTPFKYLKDSGKGSPQQLPSHDGSSDPGQGLPKDRDWDGRGQVTK